MPGAPICCGGSLGGDTDIASPVGRCRGADVPQGSQKGVGSNPTLKGCAVSLALGLVCLIAAGTLGTLIQHGAPGWLNLAVLLLGYDGIKLTLLAPMGLVWLVLHRRASHT